MKEIELKELSITDFKAQTNKVKFTELNEVRGRNESGKSTLFDAFLWLLTGADSQCRTNYKLFDERVEPTPENSKKAIVEAIISIDGVEYTLKRTAEIGWERKRNSVDYTRKGTDNYTYYIDDVKRSAGDYKAFIESTFAPLDKLHLILNIQHFLSLKWEDMRKHLESMIGEIKEADYKGDYALINDLLTKFNGNIKDIKTSLRSKINELKKSVGTKDNKGKLSIEIDTLIGTLPDINGLDAIEDEIEDCNRQIAEIDAQILDESKKVQEYVNKRSADMLEIEGLKKAYYDAKSEYELESIKVANEIKAKMADIDAENLIIKQRNDLAIDEFAKAKQQIDLEQEKLQQKIALRTKLLNENKLLKSLTFEGAYCPYCKQELPPDQVETAKREFLEKNETRRNSIIADGKANNVEMENIKAEIARLEQVINEGIKVLPQKPTDELEAKLRDLRLNFIPYDKTIKGAEMLAEIADSELKLPTIPQQDNKALTNMKQGLLNDIKELSSKLGVKDAYDRQMSIIQDKRDELKASAVELASLEGKLDKVVEYEREKASIISYRVNGMFDYVKIEMTELNKSGEMVDCCNVLDNDGINAQSTNFASKIRCGIDIAKAFSDHYGINAPIFVDFAESINSDNYPKIGNQMIKLIVDDCNLNVINL